MNDYASETGQSFTDNFIQQYIYDYFYDGGWMGVPLVSDTRVLYYNKTLFDQLHIRHPPPNGDWGIEYWKTWNWRKWYEYVEIIKHAGFPYGLESIGNWDEELKWITLMAREYNSTLLHNGECGYRSNGFKLLLEEMLIPLYKQGFASKNFYPFEKQTAIDFINSTRLYDPLQVPDFCCTTMMLWLGFYPC
jgi:hypothetical protein